MIGKGQRNGMGGERRTGKEDGKERRERGRGEGRRRGMANVETRESELRGEGREEAKEKKAGGRQGEERMRGQYLNLHPGSHSTEAVVISAILQ